MAPATPIYIEPTSAHIDPMSAYTQPMSAHIERLQRDIRRLQRYSGLLQPHIRRRQRRSPDVHGDIGQLKAVIWRPFRDICPLRRCSARLHARIRPLQTAGYLSCPNPPAPLLQDR